MEPRHFARSLWAYALIAAGGLLLLSNFGLIPAVHIREWWPLVLILVGVRVLLWPRRRECASRT